ncbi:putative Late nodulin [Medicago truncatula]|uniref:Nodule Cysteine-Rich (NCR) secreted peptide n=1 Tax=Medicago truncatula TaxID=3880 RepID=A0A072U0S0_MEDTR|nr:Nodule Cysteine-Rich (NCR) secreted peptide [Medicago truncatula]RHN46231.1 putative Late nodulin [Medicago truncatula]
MTQIIMSVYDFIIFVSLFLVVTNPENSCVTNDDCPEAVFFVTFRCIKNICVRIR